MKKLLLLTVFLLSKLLAVGQITDSVIIIQSEKELLNIGKQVYLLEDKEGKLTIKDIQKPEYQKLFKKSEQQIPNYSTTQSKVWVKLTVENKLDEKVYLEIAQALAWYIDFYKPDTLGKPILTTQTGLMRPIQNREVANNFFVFELSKNPKAQTYYFSIQSDYPIIIPLTLGSKSALLQKSSDYHLFFGMFSGLMLIMFFYNLFVAYSVRDKLYLYYCCYLLITVILINFLSGNYGYQFNPISYVSEYLIVFFTVSANMIAIFLISILALPKTSTLYKVLVVYIVLFWIFGGINLFTGHYVAFSDFVQLCIFLTFTYVLIYTLKRYLQGDKTARFVMFGFSFVLIASIVFVLQSQDLIAVNFFTSHAIVFGTELEILFFSFALGDRINKMRRDKEISQNALLAQTQENEKLIREQNMVLEQKVTERTQTLEEKAGALQIAYEEIKTTNKELQKANQQLQTANQEILIKSKEINQQKEAIETQAEQLSIANNTKDKLFSIIGHDLRGPVSSLASLLNLIAADYITQEELKTLIPDLQRNVKDIHITLENLLQWSKTQMDLIVVNPKSLNIQDLVQSHFSLFDITALNKNIKFIAKLDNTQQPYADEDHIRLVLRNLIGNALKFTPTGGTITVSSHHKLQGSTSMVEIIITDTGVGIREENRAKLFEKGQTFSTYGTAGEKGTGLGLLLCKEMIEKNSGQIGVSSEEGKGSSFYFTLPVAVG